MGDARCVPRFTLPVSSYFFFLADFFFAAFLVAMFLFSLSIVQSSSQRSFVAIVECIESLKNEVKQKMLDASCSLSSTSHKIGVTKSCSRLPVDDFMQTRVLHLHDHLITPLFISLSAITRTIPSKLSCNACAIIPGLRLLRKIASVPNIAP